MNFFLRSQNLVGTLSFSHPGEWPLPEGMFIRVVNHYYCRSTMD